MRRFTTRLAIAALAVGGGYGVARTLAPALSEYGIVIAPRAPVADAEALPIPAVAVGAQASLDGDGDRLVLTVLATLERRPNIAARVRQSVQLGDERLSGEGDFWQQGVGNQRRTRWELKTLLAGDVGYFTQVCDGDHVWTDRRLSGERQITRVYVPRVRREFAAAPGSLEEGRGAPAELAPELSARGGLSQLLAELHRSFAFGAAQSLQCGERTVRAVIGRWRPELLEREWPGLAADGSDWPNHLPHHVLMYIDNDTLFPSLVEYRGGAQATLATSSDAHFPAQHPLVAFEFIDVQIGVAMPANLFEFTPPENNYHDVTGRVIEELRPPTPQADATSTARRAGTWR